MTACQTASNGYRNQITLESLNEAAKPFSSILALPDFEATPQEMERNMGLAIAHADAALDRIASLTPQEVSFENTIRALDDLSYLADLCASRIYLMKETSQDPAIRDTGTVLIKQFQDWAVGLDYREDVYRSIKAYSDSQPVLSGEDQKLYEDILRDYHLPLLRLRGDNRIA